jgi:radical SAM superfamily enzyme YgiQ (UPF0313 family)
MIGLPGEDEESVVSIPRICARIRKETGLRLMAAVSPFVPKPGSAWHREAFAGAGVLKAKFAILSKAARGVAGTEFRIASVREASLEYALSWASAGTSRKLAEYAMEGKSNALRKIADTVDREEAERELDRLGLRKC